MPDSPQDNPPAKTPVGKGDSANRRRRPMSRWLRRSIFAFLLLLILFVVIVQILLLTNLPRNLVVHAVEQQLRLRMTAGSLSTGWLGNTELHDVTLTLPLAEHALLTIPTMKVRHSWLPTLLLTRDLTIESITIQSPRLYVTQNPSGQWSIVEVAQLLARTAGATSAQNSPSKQSIPQLPQLQVTDGAIFITDNVGRSATLSPLAITGQSQGPLVWRYDAGLPGRFAVAGKVAPGGAWSHEVDFTAQNLTPIMSAWISNWPDAARFSAQWHGQYYNDQLTGRLESIDARYNQTAVAGTLDISSQDGGVSLRPRSLSINHLGLQGANLQFNGGNLLFGGTDISASQLSVAIGGGRASIDGKYTFAGPSANLEIGWRDVRFPGDARQSGDLSVTFSNLLGQSNLKAALSSQGALNYGTWNAKIIADASGENLRALSTSITADSLKFEPTRGKPVDLSGLQAQIAAVPDGFDLTDLHLGTSNPITGKGGYRFPSQVAWLTLDARNWKIPSSANQSLNQSLDMNLNAWLNPQRIHIQQLYARLGELAIYSNADYVYAQPRPVSANVFVTDSNGTGTPADPSQPVIFSGLLRGNTSIQGTLHPLQLDFTGVALGKDIQVGKRPLGNIDVALAGTVRDKRVNVVAKAAELLGGQWYVRGYWPVENSLLKFEQVQVQHLSLPLALNRTDLSGTLDANLAIDVKRLNLNGISVDGNAAIANFKLNGNAESGAEYFAAEKIDLQQIRGENGVINLDPVKLTQAGGAATLGITTAVSHLNRMQVNFSASAWPMDLSRIAPRLNVPITAQVSTDGTLDLDLAAKTASGHLDLQTDPALSNTALGHVKAGIDLYGRQIQIASLRASSLGGTLQGTAAVNVDHPLAATAALDWTGLQLPRLAEFSPRFKNLTGSIDGSLNITPATSPRATEPLAVALKIHPTDVRLQKVLLGDLQAFANLGPRRLVSDDDPRRRSMLNLAGGAVEFWGRVSKHPGTENDPDIYQFLLSTNLRNLNLQEILGNPNGVRAPGRLNGQFTVIGQPRALDSAFGDGHLEISQSDLGSVGLIAFLYNVMNLSHDPNHPAGSGTIELRLEKNRLIIPALRYFDRGSEVRLSATISDVLNFPNSPISGSAVGSLRPLKSLELPGLTDLESAISVIQHDAVSVSIAGTVEKPTRRLIPFGELGEGMMQLLVGDVRKDTATLPQ